jgi:hypothetical protein
MIFAYDKTDCLPEKKHSKTRNARMHDNLYVVAHSGGILGPSGECKTAYSVVRGFFGIV